MTISGTTRGLTNGVCTSINRPANPYDGMVVYETDTDRAMVWNNSAWVVLSTGRANSLGLDLVKTQTIGSAVSSVVVSDAFSAIYDNYEIIVLGGIASGDLALNLTLGSTATGYYSSGFNQSITAATINATNTNNGTSFISAVYGSTNALSGRITLDNPFASKRTMVRYQATASSTTYFVNQQQGFLNDANSYTAFTLTCSTGTITGGTISVYGYAK
jgi:hypothetical protein